MAAEFAVNLAGPWLVYSLIRPRLGEFDALIASALPPLGWSLLELARFRKIDALSLLVIGSIALSVAAMALGGSPRMLLVRENIFSVPLGLAFLLTAPLRRPLIYYLAGAIFARQSASRRGAFEANFQSPPVLRGLRIMSAVWGAGLIAQGLFLGWAAWSWSSARYLLFSPIIGYGVIGAIAFWTYRYQQTLRGRAETSAASARAAAAISP